MIVTVLTKASLIEFKYDILAGIKEALERKPEEPKKWLRTFELCDLLQMSASNLQTLRNSGVLKYYKTGGFIYYDYEHIKDLLERESKKEKRRKSK